jgi:hypothetical protein
MVQGSAQNLEVIELPIVGPSIAHCLIRKPKGRFLMNRFRTWLIVTALAIGFGIAPLGAQTTAKQDAKDAGHSAKTAAKKTGSAVKKSTKKVVHKGASTTQKGAKKVEKKTSGQ